MFHSSIGRFRSENFDAPTVSSDVGCAGPCPGPPDVGSPGGARAALYGSRRGGGILGAMMGLRFSLNRLRMVPCVVALCAAAIVGAPSTCLAQEDSGPWTWYAGGGATWSDGSSSRGFNVHGGAAWTRRDESKEHEAYLTTRPPRPWRLYLAADFLFNQAALSRNAVNQVISSNPQTPTLLSATSGREKTFSATLGPTLRRKISGGLSFYALAGFGWLKRTVELTGPSSEGATIQPPSTVLSGLSGNSAAFDFGIGLSYGQIKGLAGLKIFVEQRRLQGFGVNTSTMWPISAGIRW